MRIAVIPILLLFLSKSIGQSAPAGEPAIFFDKQAILQKNGVKQVNCIYKDSRQLMWFATDNGLFRFDGTNVLYIGHTMDDTTSLPSNIVESITEDKNKRLWVATRLGPVIMDPYTFQCTRLREENNAILGYKIKFYVDDDNTVWGASDAGLFQYDNNKQVLRLVWNNIKQSNGLFRIVTCIASYNKEQLVIGTETDIVFINKHDLSFKRVQLIPGKNVTTTKVYVDSHHELWVGTWGEGLLHYNIATKTFAAFKWEKDAPNNLDNIASDIVVADVAGKSCAYVGTSEGLLKIHLKEHSDNPFPLTGSATMYRHNQADPNSIIEGGINALYADAENNLWLGSSGNTGIARIALSEPLIETLPVAHIGYITAMQQVQTGSKKYYTICSWHGPTGLQLLDQQLHLAKAFSKMPPYNDADATNISSVATDAHQHIWVSSWKGITILDSNFHLVKMIDRATKGPDTLTRTKNNYVLISGDSVWIATYKDGIDLFNTSYKRIKHYPLDGHNGLREDLVWKLYRDKAGNVWLLGNAFLYQYNPATDRFIACSFSKTDAAYNPLDMAEKKDGSLLLATENGLIHFNMPGGRYQYINNTSLQKELRVNSVCVDEADNIWYLTDEHLVSYDDNRKAFTLYGKEDGLDISKDFYALRYLGNQQLLIGQSDKLVLFHIPSVKKNKAQAYSLITGLSVNDSPVANTCLRDGLILSYYQNRINIEFACVSYKMPEQNMFAYRLKGAETEWSYTPKSNITYARLQPGRYVFEVKSANSTGVWSAVESIPVRIRYPFWQTWWFIAIMVLLLILAIYTFIRWRINRVRKAEKTKTALSQHVAQLEMKALRAQMNPHFIFNSLSSIQESILTGKTDAASKYLSKFSRLIRLILENSGKHFISLKTEIESLTLYLELESFRFENFIYRVAIDPALDVNTIQIPSMIIQPFVENALKHGLAKKEGEKELKIILKKEGQQLIALVEDNGIGRTKAAALKPAESTMHQSMGIRITEERLQLLGLQQEEKQGAFIYDLHDNEGHATGTLVKIILPIE